jgi:hypothetical protein
MSVRQFTVKVEMLKVEPLFVLGCTFDSLAERMRRDFKVNIENEPGAEPTRAGQMFTFDRAPWRLVWTRHLELPVVLHEVFHLVTRICADRGIVIRAHNERGENDDETAAYLFEVIARQVIRRCRQ